MPTADGTGSDMDRELDNLQNAIHEGLRMFAARWQTDPPRTLAFRRPDGNIQLVHEPVEQHPMHPRQPLISTEAPLFLASQSIARVPTPGHSSQGVPPIVRTQARQLTHIIDSIPFERVDSLGQPMNPSVRFINMEASFVRLVKYQCHH
jgi:hypothetical protein